MLKKENHTKILFGGPLGVYRSTRIEIDLLSGTVLIGVSVDRMNGGYWQYTVSPGETTIGKILSDTKELYLPELPEEACADPTVLHIGKPGKVTVNPELATQAVKNLKPETQGDENPELKPQAAKSLKPETKTTEKHKSNKQKPNNRKANAAASNLVQVVPERPVWDEMGFRRLPDGYELTADNFCL